MNKRFKILIALFSITLGWTLLFSYSNIYAGDSSPNQKEVDQTEEETITVIGTIQKEITESDMGSKPTSKPKPSTSSKSKPKPKPESKLSPEAESSTAPSPNPVLPISVPPRPVSRSVSSASSSSSLRIVVESSRTETFAEVVESEPESKSLVMVEDEVPPTVDIKPTDKKWGLVDLVSVVLSLITSLVMIIFAIAKKRELSILIFANAIVGVVSLVFLIVLEDFTNYPVAVTKWTPLFLALSLFNVVAGVYYMKRPSRNI